MERTEQDLTGGPLRPRQIQPGALEVDLAVQRRPFRVEMAFEVPLGDRLALFGPSGAGKTTALEAIAGLLPLDLGVIRLGNTLLSSGAPRRFTMGARHRGIGFLRQDPGLFPHLSVAANIGYGLAPGSPRSRAKQLARSLDLEGLLDARPADLSGGQRQRVAMARVLAGRFAALVLDEPFNGLDSPLRASLAELVKAETADRHEPVVLVTHDLIEAQAFGTRLGVVDAGRLLQMGDPLDIVLRPASRRVAELVGYTAFVPLAMTTSETRAVAQGASGATRDILGEVVGVHPARVLVGAHPAVGVVMSGVLTSLRAAGARREAHLTLADGTVVSFYLDHDKSLEPGSRMEITLRDPPFLNTDQE